LYLIDTGPTIELVIIVLDLLIGGRYVMGKFGEGIVRNYLIQAGLKPRKIKVRDEKTPDFEVFDDNDQLLFYVEEKTIEPDKFLEEAEPGIVVSVDDSSENSLESKFRTAVKQFTSVNEDHKVPNILAFVNLNNMVNPNDLLISLTGKGMTREGELVTIGKVRRVINDIGHIDLCLWFDKEDVNNPSWIKCNEKNDTVLRDLLKTDY